MMLVVLLCAFSSHRAEAQNPIPSWNVPVFFRANFLQTGNGIPYPAKVSRSKQTLHVAVHRTAAPLPNCGTVWFYCLETLDVLGPFPLCEGESLSVEIDEYQWGVHVESESHLVVDVWIE